MTSIRSPGIGSNLDVNSIVDQLMAVEKAPLSVLDSKEAGYQVKISAFGALKSALSTVQSSVVKLTDPNKFASLRASVGDTALFTASVVGKKVAPGNYSVEVQHLASAQKLKSAGHTDSAAIVGSGKITIQLGTYDSNANTFTPNAARPEHVITIDSTHNTLAGIRDAINAEKGDVTASIVNDGGTKGARLVLTSKYSGTANSIRVTVDDDDGLDGDATGLSELAFDPTQAVGGGKNLTQTVGAEDATVIIDGITVTKSSNTITDAIDGVTLTLYKTGDATSLDVTKDASAAKSAINDFVKAYNDFAKGLHSLTDYDAETKKGGSLLGDAGARSIETQLRSVLTSVGAGSVGAYKRLAEVGVTFTKEGLLSVDSDKLDAAITADKDAVAGLFSVQGVTSDPFVSYVSSSGKTAAGSYGVDITQLATHGTSVGQQVANLTIDAGVNDVLDFTIDGKGASVTLAAKTYGSAAELAAEIQTKMNASAIKSSSVSVTVSESAGKLTFTSDSWGSSSKVKITGGSALAGLVGTVVETDGLDVAGSIGGVAATGSGRNLTGAVGSAVEGLKLEIAGTATGARGSLTFSRGISDRLDKLIARLTGTGGIVQAKTDGYNASVKQLDKRREAISDNLDKIEARYRAQFSALDKIVSNLTKTSNFLNQQVAQWNKSSG